jgi:DNA-directed RNA polymerase specialized sigma24 family protein
MKYTYTNSTGTTEIEVDEQFYDLLVAMDKDEFNSDRKHSRRYPISLENCEYEGEWFADKKDTATAIETNLAFEQELNSLTALQRFCFIEVCVNGRTHRDVAASLGKSKFVVTQAIEGARKKLKKLF